MEQGKIAQWKNTLVKINLNIELCTVFAGRTDLFRRDLQHVASCLHYSQMIFLAITCFLYLSLPEKLIYLTLFY